MNKFSILLVSLILCTSAFAQEVADSTVAAAAVTDSAKVADVVAADSAKVDSVKSAAVVVDSATVADTAAVADTVTAAGKVDSVQVAEPVATAENAAAVVDSATIADADSATVIEQEELPLKRWYHFVGMSFSLPVEQYKIGGEKIDLVNYVFDASYMAVNRNGFSAKFSVSIGLSTTDNIQFDGTDNWQIGSYNAIEAGLGYSFVNKDKFTFALLVMMGFEYSTFVTEDNEFTHAELGEVDRSFGVTLAAITLGADAIARFALADHFGFYVGIGARWVSATASESSVTYKKDDFSRIEKFLDDGNGTYSIVPALGLMWNF